MGRDLLHAGGMGAEFLSAENPRCHLMLVALIRIGNGNLVSWCGSGSPAARKYHCPGVMLLRPPGNFGSVVTLMPALMSGSAFTKSTTSSRVLVGSVA